MAKSKHPPNPDDVAIGARVKARRCQLGMSQGALAEPLGLTFQQIQKYERGTNRIGGSRMLAIAKALKCPVESLFGANESGAVLDELAGFAKIDIEIARAAKELPADMKPKVLGIIKVLAEWLQSGRDLADAVAAIPGDDFSRPSQRDPGSGPGRGFRQ